ncbi:hypothetical protein CN162_12560 [Sinorhizobium meliloti]|uniref:hypothetical protein n=1 Tax=Rhizobium meliloti TaxID=382 RepID=UPI000FD50DF3|nr:hypothetical protein [Sinorhizobium meliloti]RVG48074.1 hypothetical protein CN224_31340 [Sinorhizobium meliloti]RVK56896.1 hypothetical protein CN162_12560 [Sinorhizobium meliloti]
MSDPIRIIRTQVFSTVTDVRLYEETLNHIKEQHPEVPIELPSLMEALSTAIQAPTHVEASHTNSYVFVDSGSTNASGNPLRIPVKVIEGTSGLIKTAFFSDTLKPGTIVYRRSK